MKLRTLLKGLPELKVKGSQDVFITGICSHSKFVAPGNIFVARKGRKFDGEQFIQEAVAAGAAAILTDLYNPFLEGITQILASEPILWEALLASRCYQSPSDELFLAGITGTKGKTTSAFYTQFLLDQLQGPCGMVGTIEYRVGAQRYQASLTTPDAPTNQKLLREMVGAGCRSAVMEVTSHALEQNRTEHIHFDAALFTNLSHDHLDYHGTMEKYAEAKRKLFLSLTPHKKNPAALPRAILNADSPDSQKMSRGCAVPLMTYGIEEKADLQGIPCTLDSAFTELRLSYEGKEVHARWPIVGRFNLSNALGAAAIALSQGHPLEIVAELLSQAPSIPGRLQRVENALHRSIFVDYAHTPDSLEKVLLCLREITAGRLLVVFGCGGERDRQKRPMMARIAEELADSVIVTTDNPRGENPAQILQEILKGFSGKQFYQIEPDRRKAFEMAISEMHEEDTLLLAGKGHEYLQVFAHHTVEFNDALVAQEICRQIAQPEGRISSPILKHFLLKSS